MLAIAKLALEVVPLEDPTAWDAAIAATGDHDAFHHAAFHQAFARGRRSVLLVARDRGESWVLPLELHPLTDAVLGEPGVDAISVYGFTGPVWSRGWAHDRHRDAWHAVSRSLREWGAVTVFIRTHPLLTAATPVAEGARLQVEGEVVVMDLALDEASYWGEMRSGHRRNLRRAMRDGLRAAVHGDHRHVGEFFRIYGATMDRVSAGAAYRFAFDRLRVLMASSTFRSHVVTASHGDRVLAAGLFLCHPPYAHYFLAGSEIDHPHGSRPMRLVVHEARKLLKEEGCSWLNLGGGVGAERDSLFDFKAEFSGLRRVFTSVRWVLDAPRYEQLCRQAGMVPAPNPTEDWFPAYRKPG